MPPRNQTGELDEISRMIGELSAYVHEGRHGVNNLSTKFDALALDIAKRVETMKTEISLRLDTMDRRIALLEGVEAQRKGERGAVAWIVQSPLVGWIVGGAVAVWAVITGKVQP